MALVITQAFESVFQQNLAQLTQRAQPLPVHHEKDVEEYLVAMKKVGMPTSEEGVDQDKVDIWFGQIEKFVALLKLFEMACDVESNMRHRSSIGANNVRHVVPSIRLVMLLIRVFDAIR
ncbi:hypothetical protein ACH5RR_029755 [Cinchona calisaya]|uniref:Uncharacterized protein n=1 Tax=Cinchona calisaya TaxID=153742 RepID=A0ABD2YVV3_9GENT